jgi:hypothetical protein
VTGNFVTKNVGTHSRRGRPRKHASPAAKQAAHRARKREAITLQRGCRVEHPVLGRGLVVHVNGGTATVIYRRHDGRLWKELEVSKLTILAGPKPLPKWTNPRERSPRVKGPFQLNEKREEAGRMPGERFVRKYGRRVRGKSRIRKDYSQLIDANLVRYIMQAKGTKK